MKTLLALIVVVFSTSNMLIAQNEIMLLKPNGKVVIGDTSKINTNGNYSLFVQQGILTERVKVALKNTSQWSDDAFKNTPSIEEMSASIENEKHLLEMPSASELVKSEGYEILDMDAKLLQQVEWLWQHVIELNKQNEVLRKEIESCSKK